MAAIKKLAGQTIWYGGSNIAARLLNYLLTPLLTRLLHDAQGVQDYGDYSLIYSWIAVLNILFTYGFETGYFRFSNKEGVDKNSLFDTTFGSMIVSSVLLIIGFSFFVNPINAFLKLNGHPEYIIWTLMLIGVDAISTIPFARLRQDNKPRKYAFVKVAGIVVNIIFTLIFLVFIPRMLKGHTDSGFARWYFSNNKVGLLLLANLLQNFFVFFVLYGEWKQFRFRIDKALWKKIFAYSSPMIIIGLAGMVNEVMDRQMLTSYLPLPEPDAKRLVGIYSANYKLAIFITLFIQAFRMAAEPFFFSQAKDKNAPAVYAKVMKWFVITLAIAFLFTALYLDVWIRILDKAYRSGVGIVPVLLFANVCLGMYYNLSVWYKLTDNMRKGLYITVFGAIITFVGNYVFIPNWGMYAAAWTTCVCYASMVVVTYFFGQKYYPVPYSVKKILSYLTVMLLLFFTKKGIDLATGNWGELLQLSVRIAGATVLMGLFLMLVVKVEKAEMKGMPFIGKYLR